MVTTTQGLSSLILTSTRVGLGRSLVAELESRLRQATNSMARAESIGSSAPCIVHGVLQFLGTESMAEMTDSLSSDKLSDSHGPVESSHSSCRILTPVVGRAARRLALLRGGSSLRASREVPQERSNRVRDPPEGRVLRDLDPRLARRDRRDERTLGHDRVFQTRPPPARRPRRRGPRDVRVSIRTSEHR